MAERKLPYYKPRRYDPDLRRALDVPPGSEVFVFIAGSSPCHIEPFKAKVKSVEQTRQEGNPRVKTELLGQVVRVKGQLKETIFKSGQTIFLGSGTTMRILK